MAPPPGGSTGPDANTAEDRLASARLPELASALLSEPASGTAATAMARAADATYDFDEYVLLRDRDDPISVGTYPQQPIPADQRFQRFLAKGRAGIQSAIEYALLPFGTGAASMGTQATALTELLFRWWREICSVRAFNRLARYDSTELASRANSFGLDPTSDGYYGQCLRYWLMSFASVEMQGYLGGDPDAVDLLLTVDYWEKVRTRVFDEYFNGLAYADSSGPNGAYPFEPLPVDDIVFGLRVVHRQSWRQLAFGRGDLVGTVPLGPRETRKVSVKSTRRSKISRSAEEGRSFETSAESTESAKDTSEVVDEATKSVNKHAEAEITGSYPPFVNAKVSGGISEDTGSSSKQTKTSLNEMMQKTASRMKRDTKVVVSTEEETTFERSASSEITNPNDELGVTYLYRRLQQRYWVSAQIDEVNSIVLVPEPVPEFASVDESWVGSHADIIAGALLDPSYTGLLTAIRTEPGDLKYTGVSVFQNAADSAIGATGSYAAYTGGGDLPDVLASGQQFYERDFERRESLAMDQARRRHQVEGLLAHVRRNILHYMRAIWNAEDPDQRMQRYTRLRVPIEWTFVPRTPVAGTNVGVGVGLDIDGVFMPSLTTAAPLDDIIDPVGPIGYLFNCSIWRVRDNPRLVNLHQALAHLRAAYTRFSVKIALIPGSDLTVRQTVAIAPRRFSADYGIIWKAARSRWLIPVAGKQESDWIHLNLMPDGSIDVLGIRVWLDGNPANDEQVTIAVRVTGEIQDPHLRLTAVQSPLPPIGDEETFFSDGLLEDMASLFEWLPPLAGRRRTWADLTVAERDEARARYHEFVMLRESGRLVTIDTANLVLDLELGGSAVLEPFKRLHRYVDVMKEYEELHRREIDNRRRKALVDRDQLGDPDIERVTVVGNVGELIAGIAVDSNGVEEPIP